MVVEEEEGMGGGIYKEGREKGMENHYLPI